jgi:4-hydroxy-tetrahydrodipicolinate synthase
MNELTVARIKNGFFPAVPVIVDEAGNLDIPVMQDYIDWLSPQGIAGVAVWAHTGRGLKLDRSSREKVAEMWRCKLGEKLLICGVGSQAGTIDDVIDLSLEMARHARDCGADVLLAFPPARLIDRTHHDIVRYHRELTKVGLPILAFYLYEAGGGIHYDDQLLRRILELPGVVGLKVATLDSVMRFQEIAQLMTEFPQKVLVTGEDRMLGYTLMLGATAALVGLGGVHTAIQLGMFGAWHQKDYSTFIRLSKLVDTLAEVTFVEPMEGYIGRVLYCLSVEGIIPSSATRDPWGPILTAEEKHRIIEVMDYLCSRERM